MIQAISLKIFLFFTPQMRRLFEGGVYLKMGRDKELYELRHYYFRIELIERTPSDLNYIGAMVDCEQSSPFFVRFSAGSARAPRDARNESGSLPVSCLQSRACSFSCHSHLARRTKKKERLLIVLGCGA